MICLIEVVYGTDRFLVLEKIESIRKKINKQDTELEWHAFDASDSDFTFGRVLEAYETISLFSGVRAVFLHVQSEKDLSKIDERALLGLLEKPSMDAHLLLALPKRYLTKNPLRKALSSHAQEHLIDTKKEHGDNALFRIKKELQKRNIAMSDGALKLFVNRIGSDLSRLEGEVDKLALFDKVLDVQDIENLITHDLARDIFALGNALLSKDRVQAFRIYHSLLNQKNDPLNLAPLIASNLRSIYQVETLIEKGYSASKIKEMLKMSDGQFWNITNRQMGKVSNVLEALNELAELDQASKLGEIDRFVAFELFMVKMMR